MADLPTEVQREEHFDLSYEEILQVEEDLWMMYFNRASNQKGIGEGILLVSLKVAHIPILVKLDFEVTNNMAKYEYFIIGLQTSIEIGVKKLWLYEDSNLIINQISQKWKVRSKPLAPYKLSL